MWKQSRKKERLYGEIGNPTKAGDLTYLGSVRVRKWSQDRKWSRTANDPQIGPQVIPDRKWSPYWTANDPDQKIRNGMDGRIGWIGKWCTWIPIFFSLCLNARQPGKVLKRLNARQSENFHRIFIERLFQISWWYLMFLKKCRAIPKIVFVCKTTK